jgi:kynurenine formamidase
MTLPKFKFVDLSVPIKSPNPGEMSPDYEASLAAIIDYQDHQKSIPAMTAILGCTKEDLLEGQGWGNESLKLVSHAGTHVDAPYHYFPTCQGNPARTISDCPLEWYFGEGVVLDLRHKKDGECVTVQDIKDALKKINHTLKYGDIVCLRFDADKKFGTAAYWTEFPGMSGEATRYILDQGVKVIGTDAIGFDIPFENTKKLFAKTGDRKLIWEAHRAGRDYDYSHIEKLANLDKVPPTGFYIACFPVNIYKASAGWTRAVGMIPVE